ncbi:Mucin-2 [Rhizoctonia solani]|uniref:Mucin-2 n=1 Tax=Rhizoctonia solani TaxID=456999 RepID=A0A0K6G792_9AGAM|nr:Mucin-2 [Rhizoctonia solani]
MRRAPSSRGKDAEALRFSVFDAAHQIGLSDPNALRWLEQNSNISEEDEEEQPETRPTSDAHPPSLVFSSSSSEPDSSIMSPSNDHSTSYRGAFPRYQASPYAQPHPKHPNFQSPAQIYPDSRPPLGPNGFNTPNPLSRLQIPAQKPSDPWSPTPLAIASLSPISQPASRAPTPGDKGSIKQIPEPKKSKKLTKAPRGGESESESVPSRKGSASGGSGNPNVVGSSGAPPTLPFLPFPSAISAETLRSDASVSGLSVVSGASASSSGTVTQSMFTPSLMSNEPRSVFEDDDSARNSPIGGPSGHTHNSLSTSTVNSSETTHAKDKEGKLIRTMRSFKLSLKSQKNKANPAEAPPVPNLPSMPSMPPVLTLELDKGAGLSGQLSSTSPPNERRASPQTRDKEREERVLRIADMFTSELSRNTRSGSESGNVSSIYTTQSHSDSGHGVKSDLGHTLSNPAPKPELPHASHSDLGHAPIRIAGAARNIQMSPPVVRRRSVDESDAALGDAVKATERTRAGTVGVRNGHARTRSKSGDFTGLGWEKGGRPAFVPNANGKIVAPVPTIPAVAQRPMAKPPPTKKPPKPTPARKFFVTNPSRISTATTVSPPRVPSESSPASPTPQNKPLSPTLAFDGDSKHSLEREEPEARGAGDTRAWEVQNQLQSFVASMRGTGGYDGAESIENTFGRASTYEVRNSEEGSGRGSQDSRKPFARLANDTDTLRSSEEYDPFRAQSAKLRPTPVNQPRPESEALPHQFHIPLHEIPKEISQAMKSTPSGPAKRSNIAPPTSFRTPESELPTGLVRTSSISARPSVTIHEIPHRPMSADLMEATPLSIVASEEPAKQADTTRNHIRAESKESELGFSKFDLTGDVVGEPVVIGSHASEAFITPSPSWAPLELKRARSGSVSATLDSNTPQVPDAPTHPGQFLDVRADRQRASGLSIPRSVTPDSPRPLLEPRPALSPPPRAPSALSVARSVTPLAPSRSVTPIAPLRPTASPAPRTITPQPARALSPQARAASPALSRTQQRDTPSPPLPRNRLPTRTSSVSSTSSIGHGAPQRVRSPAATLPSGPRPTVVPTSRLAPAPTPRPSTASTVQSVASTSSLGLPLRSTSVTPTPRDEPLPHEQSSRFLDPESIPTAQQRGRVSPFPMRPLKSRTGSRDQLREVEQPVQTQREKYPGGAEKLLGDGLPPRVRFIGVRSSNGSSQAGWQGRMEDMRHVESPAQSDRWPEEETRPVSWQEYEEPSYLGYDDEENTQGYYEGLRYSAYEEEPASGDARNTMPITPMDPEPIQDAASTLATRREQPGWVLNDSSPASRESTFTLASVYDDEDEDVTPIPKAQKLAAAVRGMSQNGWASRRI